jgi:hypothetical protein
VAATVIVRVLQNGSVLEALMRISADVGFRVTSECSNVVWILNEV